MSPQDLCEKYNCKYSHIQKLLKNNNISIRSIKESKLTTQVKEKYKNTMLERYGVEHNFCKDSESRKIWEKRLLDEEGTTNVFQRDSVKEKIKLSLIEHYGEDVRSIINSKEHILEKWMNLGYSKEEAELKWKDTCHRRGNSMRLSYYIDKYGQKGEEIYKQNILSRNVPTFDTDKFGRAISSLNIRFKELLDELNISYEMEYPIWIENTVRFYDFRIDNYLIELNGDFWHANPKIYQADDILNFPQFPIKAQDLWAKDLFKKQLAELNNFKVIYIWESVINSKKKCNQIKRILTLYGNNKNKENNQNTSN